MAELVVISGPERGRRYTLQETTTLGRSSRSTICIEHESVSRQHARIWVEDGQYWIEDLNSVNGTFVNERNVTRWTLEDNDTIRIADCTFAFKLEHSEERTFRTKIIASKGSSHSSTISERVDAQTGMFERKRGLADVQDSAKDLAERLWTVYAVAEAISTILDQDQLLARILETLLLVFDNAARGIILGIDPASGELFPRAIKHRDGQARSGDVLISRTVVKEVLGKKRAVIFGGVGQPQVPATDIHQASVMCAPMIARNKTLGVIHLTSSSLETPFVRADLDLLVGTAVQAALALQNAELHAELVERERLRQELKVATEIQRHFLPRQLPTLPSWSFAAEYAPAQAIGGDFYDFIWLDSTRLGIVIGDVSGKGVSAALLMARFSSELRYLALVAGAPSLVMARANASLLSAGYEDFFITACYLELNTETGLLTLCNAGHLPPMVRSGGGRTPLVQHLSQSNLALGVIESATYAQETFQLQPGDTLFLMTDGVIEATNPEHEQYGLERVEALVAQASGDAEALVDTVLVAVQAFSANFPQYDDLTLVCLSMKEALPAASPGGIDHA